MKEKICVIGAGYGGLTTACLLAKKGYDVTLLEKNSTVGGRGRMFKTKGFSFDMGPSWYLMPDTVNDIFKILGTTAEKEMQLTRLDPHYKMFFHDEEVLIRKDMKKNYELFEKLEPGVTPKVKKYLNQAKYKFEVSVDNFIEKPYLKVTDMINLKMLKEGKNLDIFQSFDSHLKKHFNSDKLRKIMGYTMVFLGGSPKNTPALYSLMSHGDFNLGVYYPKGGMNALAKALEKQAKKLGVKIKTNTDVKKIKVENKKAKKIKTNKAELSFDKIVVNADYAWAETNLLEKKYQTYNKKYWSKKTIAPSGLIMYLGIKGKVKNLEHHNLMIQNNWMKHFNEIFEKPSWPKAPSYYVCAPSKTDDSVAPKEDENLFVLVPVAPGLKDTEKTRKNYADKIIKDLEKRTGEKIKDRIIVKKIYSQKNFKEDYNAYKGTALGLAQTLFQTALFRPKNKSKKVKNLYYVGQYTNPGTGVPIAMISAKIVTKLIQDDTN
ncbi:MAG: phytoene desaturase family protein [Candidatus Woesearchaeota archaeon]